jgi:hypothetical protein
MSDAFFFYTNISLNCVLERRSNMTDKIEGVSPRDEGSDRTDLKSLLTRLAREDLKLKLPLVDAALTGATLALKPSNHELRVHAAQIWASIKATLEQHLRSENEKLLKWAESRSEFSHALLERTNREHAKINELLSEINAIPFENSTDENVAKAAHDLCALAVNLDDMIAGEERDLFPMVRRALFAGVKARAGH